MFCFIVWRARKTKTLFLSHESKRFPPNEVMSEEFPRVVFNQFQLPLVNVYLQKR